jgi:hypothetical protein
VGKRAEVQNKLVQNARLDCAVNTDQFPELSINNLSQGNWKKRGRKQTRLKGGGEKDAKRKMKLSNGIVSFDTFASSTGRSHFPVDPPDFSTLPGGW